MIFNKRKRNKIISNQLKLNINKKKINKIGFIIILFIFIIFLSIKHTPEFKIKEIYIYREDNISNIPNAHIALENIKNQYIFFIDKEKIKNSLKSYQENLKNIKIDIKIPNKIEIYLSSYDTIYKTIIDEKKYLITSNGVLIPNSNENNELENINLNSIKFPNFLQYKKLLNEKDLTSIKYIENKINENLLNLSIIDIFYYKTEREIHIKISNDILLIFDLNGDIDKQIEKLLIFDKESTPLIKANINYIDLRINNKIFYCEKENNAICDENLKKIYSTTE